MVPSSSLCCQNGSTGNLLYAKGGHMPLLQIAQLSKRYGTDKYALDRIDFTVATGEFVAIIRPSGAGKSTATTLHQPHDRLLSSGDVLFNDTSTKALSAQQLRTHRTQIGMIFQHYNLVNRLSVIENVLHRRLGYKSTAAGVMGWYSDAEKTQRS
jgi:phosphonate transport system ATP-binding protein